MAGDLCEAFLCCKASCQPRLHAGLGVDLPADMIDDKDRDEVM